jgi:hypothetical protein
VIAFCALPDKTKNIMKAIITILLALVAMDGQGERASIIQ